MITVTVLRDFTENGMRFPAGAGITVDESLAKKWAERGDVKLPEPKPEAKAAA